MINSLEQIVDTYNHTYSDSSIQICDDNFYFQFSGKKALVYMETTRDEANNKRLSEINSPIQHLATEYRKINEPVLTGKVKKSSYTTYVKTKNSLVIAKSDVKPIIINDKIAGLFIDNSITNNVLNFDFSIFGNSFNENSATITKMDKSNKEYQQLFTEIEELIVFLIVIGKVDKEIADLLQTAGVFLSRAGVSKLIARKIFPKLNTDTRNQFISQVFYRGLIKGLPSILLNNQELFNLTFKGLMNYN